MDNIIRHNGIKHWKLQFICEVPTCLNVYRDKVLLGTHMYDRHGTQSIPKPTSVQICTNWPLGIHRFRWFLVSLISMFSVVLTKYIGAWCLGIGYSTAKPIEEEKSNKWTRKVV
ncbi:hypothetical protein GIB67_041700, partial [Kingdonia uniflora]